MPELEIEEFIIVNASGLKASAKRYRPNHPDTLTHNHTQLKSDNLEFIWLFAHGVGSHKELWEVTIRRLFSLSSRCVEAWSVDAHTHGASARMNREIIGREGWVYDPSELAQCMINIYETYIQPTNMDTTKLILVGHSAGGTALAFTALTHGQGPFPFAALALVDPPLGPIPPRTVPVGPMTLRAIEASTPQEIPMTITDAETPLFTLSVKNIPHRASAWASREVARAYLKEKIPWGTWDPRVFESYVNHGLEERDGRITLCCSPAHEASSYKLEYMYPNGAIAMGALGWLIGKEGVPVHLIFGERSDLISKERQDALQNALKFASTTRVPGGGHLIVQEAPDAVADALYGILTTLEPVRGVKL